MEDVLQGSTETLVHRGAAFVYKDLPGSQMELGELSQCHSSKPSPAAAAAAGSFLAQTMLCVYVCVVGGEVSGWVLFSAKLTQSSVSRLMASHLAGLSGSAVVISVASTAQQQKGLI